MSHCCRISSVYWLDRMHAGRCSRKGLLLFVCVLIVTKGHNFNMLKTKSLSWASGRVFFFFFSTHPPRSKGEKNITFSFLTWDYSLLTWLRAFVHGDQDDKDFLCLAGLVWLELSDISGRAVGLSSFWPGWAHCSYSVAAKKSEPCAQHHFCNTRSDFLPKREMGHN